MISRTDAKPEQLTPATADIVMLRTAEGAVQGGATPPASETAGSGSPGPVGTPVSQQQPTPVDPPRSAASMSLEEGFDFVAAAWGEHVASAGTVDADTVPGPEALADMAARRGLHVDVRYASAASLARADFPCLLLMRDGSTRVLLGRQGSAIEVRVADGISVVQLNELTSGEAGVVLLPRPAVNHRPPEASDLGQGEEPADQKAGVLRLILGMMWREHRGRLMLMAVANLIGNFMLLALPLYSMAIYDRVVPHLAMETLWALSLGVMIALLADLMVRAVKARVLDSVCYSVSTAVQARFFNRLVHMELASAPRSAAAASQGLRDIESICHAVPNVFTALVIDLPFLIVTVALLASFGGYVALVPVFAAILLVVIYAVSHAVGEREALRRAGLSRLQTNLLQESIDGLETVKATAAENTLLRRWEKLSDAAAYSGHVSRSWSGLATIASLSLGQVVIVGGMVAAVMEISNGMLTIGALSATSLLVGRVLAPITQVVSTLHHTKTLLKTLDGIDSVLQAPAEQAGDPTRMQSVHGLIEFRGVSFTYPGTQEGGLKDVTFAIRPGERVAIIGRIGCGKSTLLRLMLRLHSPTSGAVLLDGRDIRQFDPRHVRRKIGLMNQQHTLFDDTLHANLVFGLGRVTREAFERAAAVSAVRDLAARQPDGYAMHVGPRGERLSGGERQIVALARTLMGHPEILVLDEPTAAMDNALEARIVRDLKLDLGQRTLIVSTHRGVVLDLVDRIIWLDDGRIVADGPKEEVLNRLRRTAA